MCRVLLLLKGKWLCSTWTEGSAWSGRHSTPIVRTIWTGPMLTAASQRAAKLARCGTRRQVSERMFSNVLAFLGVTGANHRAAYTGTVLVTIQLESDAYCVRASPADPAVIFIGGLGGLLLMWNTATNVRTPLPGVSSNIFSLCVSEDGKFLASGSIDRKVRLWETTTGRCLWTSTRQRSWMYGLAMFGSTVFCGVSNSNAVGLQMSDGAAGPTFAEASGNVWGVVVTKGTSEYAGKQFRKSERKKRERGRKRKRQRA
jgi:WD40 repeat protein